jgi:hypothetical protein
MLITSARMGLRLAAALGSCYQGLFFEDQFELIKTGRHFLGTTRPTHHQNRDGLQ